MINVLQSFVNAKNTLLTYFNCGEDFPVRVYDDVKWELQEIDGMYFLTCHHPEGKLDYAVVRKEKRPLFLAKNGYTMVVAIDCIKFAFIFNNKHRIK